MNVKKIIGGLILASSGLWAMGASAVVIPAWDWMTDGGFIESTATCSNGATQAACDLGFDNATGVTPSGIAGTSSIMTWGDGTTSNGGNGEQSGLQAVNGASGAGGYDAAALGSGPVPIGAVLGTTNAFEQLITNGGWTNIGAAVHYNNVITSAGGYMDTSQLETMFSLTGPAAVGLPPDVVNISLNETINSSPCAFPNPHGTICDDLFDIDPLAGPVTFFAGGRLYRLSFQYLAGQGAILDGTNVYTQEVAPGFAVLYSQARIDTIPAPGVLALMGVGLLALGWRVRKAV